ncbi:hypothetical protein HAX54_045808 [Datura stramonium]|uniref:Uncharacterized protein n=1 Tax=Datura stramonium TaxID=4076 RepID=A0ABS8SQZ2_DATST|nr:hypothetical protein [Datura stramonium]
MKIAWINGDARQGQASCPLPNIVPLSRENMVEDHRKVEEEGVTFGMFEEELALLLLSWLINGCSTRRVDLRKVIVTVELKFTTRLKVCAACQSVHLTCINFIGF